MHVITPVEKTASCCVACFQLWYFAVAKSYQKNPHQILKGTITFDRVIAGALVSHTGAALQGCRATEGEEKTKVPASEGLNELEIVTKGNKDIQQNDGGRGKAETMQIEKISVDHNVLVRSRRESFCLLFFGNKNYES